MIEVVAFDWGGTLMKEEPGRSGPMAHWPAVAAVDGAAETLSALADAYRLVVATNADASTADLVLAALARVDLARHIAAVFSSADLGWQKPQRRFYDTVVAALRCRPEAVLMVGDSYTNDIRGAHGAGLRTAWFNPQGQPAPPSPQHDIELRCLTDLPDALAAL